jgi:hypothetical protein
VWGLKCKDGGKGKECGKRGVREVLTMAGGSEKCVGRRRERERGVLKRQLV